MSRALGPATIQEERSGADSVIRSTGPTRRTRVYVSGPLTTGMMTANVRRAADVATALLDKGYAVYLPHTNVVWEMIAPPAVTEQEAYDRWLNHDFEWVGACDAILRLPGPSAGADKEVALAKVLGVRIYLSTEMLYACEPVVRRVR